MGSLSPQADINHGTFFWHAYEKGYIKPGHNVHAGIRTRFSVSLGWNGGGGARRKEAEDWISIRVV